MFTAEDDEALYLRGCEETTHHSLVLRKGTQPAAACLAFRVWAESISTSPSSGTANAVAASSAGPPGQPEESAKRSGSRTRSASRSSSSRRPSAPSGSCSASNYTTVLRSPGSITSTSPSTTRPPRTTYYESLGFRCSETIEDEHRLYAAWMHRKPSVHDVAMTGGASPRLHHIGFFTPEAHHILRLCDLFGAIDEQQHHLERGPGRHGVSNAFYLYLRDHDGHRIEIYTSDYFTGDPDHETYRWNVNDMRRSDFWGAAVVPSWYAESTPVLDLDGRIVPANADRSRQVRSHSRRRRLPLAQRHTHCNSKLGD